MAYQLMEEQPAEDQNAIQDFGQETGRHAARTTSNIATLGVGLPGDIFSLINDFIAKPAIESITGEQGAEYAETPLGKILPTTETHRKNIESKFGEYLKPKNKVEKFVDDVVEDAASITNPAKLIHKGAKKGLSILKNFYKSIGANVVGETVKQNVDESSGTYAKAGALFISSLLDQEATAKQIGKLYRQAEAALPPNAMTNANVLERNINNLEYKITKNRPQETLSPPEKFVINQSDKVRKLIHNGGISVEQAIAQKRSLNKELTTLYKDVPKFSEQKTVKNLAKQINGFLSVAIGEYGRTNPEFYVPYKNADQAFGTLAKSNFISQWVEGNVVQHPLTSGLMHLFSPIATGAALAAVPYQVAKLTYRIANSQTLAKIYAKTVTAAAKEDKVAFNKYLKELDASMQEEESNDRYEFVD
jgi:hypothetical protein